MRCQLCQRAQAPITTSKAARPRAIARRFDGGGELDMSRTGVVPRMKCCRCREFSDSVGSDDTEVFPELAGATIARIVGQRRAARKRAERAGRERKRRRLRRAKKLATAGAAAAPPSAEAI